ncbi:MAG: hypothetical protein KGI37_08180 [Alphaproteobacteria bacterium]|nr:hypothetical protein [Alphaproteobacteria bacterium]
MSLEIHRRAFAAGLTALLFSAASAEAERRSGGARQNSHKPVLTITDARQSLLQKRVAEDFAFAEQHGIILAVASASVHAGISPLDMLCLAFKESDLGQNCRVDATSTAQGVMQITAGTFVSLLQSQVLTQPPEVADQAKKLIAEHGGAPAKTMLQGIAQAKKIALGAHAGKETNLPPQEAPPAHIVRNIVHVIHDRRNVKLAILDGRNSPFASTYLTAMNIADLRAANPGVCAILQGAECRMFHMFGVDTALDIVKASQKEPHMEMRHFLPAAALANNDINAKMPVGSFVAAFKRDYHKTRDIVAAHYAAYRGTHPAAPAASRPMSAQAAPAP